jgi:hypothetical protein
VYAGHVGIALGAKGFRKSLPLWALIIASQLPDWTDATLCMAGIRSSTPGMFSHSIPAVAVLTLLGSLVYLVSSRDMIGSWFIGALVISHILGDYLTGIKPTWSGGPMIGLRLYQQPVVDFALEATVILIGWLIYRASFPAEKKSSPNVYTMLGVLVGLQFLADVIFSVSPGIKKC